MRTLVEVLANGETGGGNVDVILHIGTHKTGSSTFQFFSAVNRDLLEARGLYYAFNSRKSSKNSNFLGGNISKGKDEFVKRFVNESVDIAEQKGLKRLVISGETMYAMSAFYPKFGETDSAVYWETEEERISRLLDIFDGCNVTILCYVRRQDDFAESLYSQMVKSGNGYAGTIQEFIDDVPDLYDYYGHLSLWGKFVGDDAVSVRVFDRKKNTIADFYETILGNADFVNTGATGGRAAERLHYDVLAYKRQLNACRMSPVKGYVVQRAFMEMSTRFPAQRYSWMSTDDRAALLEKCADSNRKLVEKWLPENAGYFDADFQSVDPMYPGLSDDQRQTVQKEYRKMMRDPVRLVNLWVREALWVVERKLPASRFFLRPFRGFMRTYRRLRWAKS